MKKNMIMLLLFLLCQTAGAQSSGASFNFLRLPTSAHLASMGGDNISFVEDAPWAGYTNPALYANVSNNALGLHFMTFTSGSQLMGAEFVKAFGDRHTGAITAQLMNYGKMDETDGSGNVLGTFSAKDFSIGAAYSYLMSKRWTGGAALNFIYSGYADYNATALAVNLGLNYYDEEQDFSLSATASNIGFQMSTFDGYAEKLPFNLQVGFTKGMNHLPVRFSVTMSDLTRWKKSYFYNGEEDLSFGKLLLNHFVVGLDVQPVDFLYLSAGYNFRRANELKAAGSGHGAGLSFGGGITLKRFKAGISYAKYHVSTASLMFNAGYNF